MTIFFWYIIESSTVVETGAAGLKAEHDWGVISWVRNILIIITTILLLTIIKLEADVAQH